MHDYVATYIIVWKYFIVKKIVSNEVHVNLLHKKYLTWIINKIRCIMKVYYTDNLATLKYLILEWQINYEMWKVHWLATSIASNCCQATTGAMGWHSNIFCTSIFKDERQGTTTEIADGQKSNCLLAVQGSTLYFT